MKSTIRELIDGEVSLEILDNKPLDYLKEMRYIVGHSGIYSEGKLELLEYLNRLITKKEAS